MRTSSRRSRNTSSSVWGSNVAEKKYTYVPGQKVHSWTLIQKVRDNPSSPPNLKNRWRCECVCGTRETIPAYYFTRKPPKMHCGCLRKTIITKNKRVHNIWSMMRTRCNNPEHVSYAYYGGRGIRVCPEWDDPVNGFARFLEYMGNPPSPNHTLDRYPDNNAGYEPGNVRWADAKQQRANQRPRGEQARGTQNGKE